MKPTELHKSSNGSQPAQPDTSTIPILPEIEASFRVCAASLLCVLDLGLHSTRGNTLVPDVSTH